MGGRATRVRTTERTSAGRDGRAAQAEPSDRLARYRARRDFERSPEPPPVARRAKRVDAGTLAFVVQRHDARRLHYDVRLQIGDAMMSFAVPKGPSFDPTVKRLAVETEDHPLAYNAFEGRIPAGEYGAGEVLVWDRGTYESIPPGEEARMRAKGHLHVRLRGEKLHGDWHFVRMAHPGRARASAADDKAQWLMFKGSDGAAPGFDVLAAAPGSVLARRPAARARPALSRPDKVLFPRDAITKREVADYYDAVAEVMLPHLVGRPVAVERWPDGIDGQSWFQQHPPAAVPPFVRVETIEGRRRLLVDNRDTLAWLANLAALTLHVWGSHVPFGTRGAAAIDDALDRPDWVIFDLDPGDGPFEHVIRVARALRRALDGLGLASLPKTSGKRGLHVLVPIARVHPSVEVKRFARAVAAAVVAHLPALATIERNPKKRGGRLYVDWLQNGRGKTIAAPYTLRAVDGAPASTPLDWSEVGERLDPRAFDLRAVRRRVERKGDLFAAALRGAARLPRTA